MDVEPSPVLETLGIEMETVEDGHARATLEMREELSTVEGSTVAQGGIIAALADAAGFWALSSANDFDIVPTIDLRLDYLAPATDDMVAEADVVQNGETVGIVEVGIYTDERKVAAARGVFKTGGADRNSTWEAPLEDGPDSS